MRRALFVWLVCGCAESRTRVNLTISSTVTETIDRLDFDVRGDGEPWQDQRTVTLSHGGSERIVFYPASEDARPVIEVVGASGGNIVAFGRAEVAALRPGAAVDAEVVLVGPSSIFDDMGPPTGDGGTDQEPPAPGFAPTLPVRQSDFVTTLPPTVIGNGQTVTIMNDLVIGLSASSYTSSKVGSVLIVRFGQVTIEQGGSLHLLRRDPVALVSAGTFVIKGTIVAQDCVDGEDHGLGEGKDGVSEMGQGGGGGGAGHAGPGGNGGHPRQGNIGGGLGGVAYPTPSQFALELGSAGGHGADAGGPGGRGGGALQVVARQALQIGPVYFFAEAGINAGGCGAATGGSSKSGGSGGGSGGSILLESPQVRLELGSWVAAGGGGGSGGGGGQPGGPAVLAIPAAGGGPSAGAGAGGRGGWEDTTDVQSGGNGGSMEAGGGGGGAVGRIRILTQTGALGGYPVPTFPTPNERVHPTHGPALEKGVITIVP